MVDEQVRRPGRPRAGGEDKRERILSEAVRLFARSGYAATSLSDVAKAAHISKAGLLHHFSSKHALFSAVLEHRDSVDLPAMDSGNIWDLLASFADLMDRNGQTPSMVGLYMVMAVDGTSADHPAHRWLLQHFEHAVLNLERAFEQGKTDGLVHPDAPSLTLARSVVALADGIQLQWLCEGVPGGEPVQMGDQIRQMAELIRARWAM
ncbi:TetR/AcrR family transcriptional regulator [Ruania halotolerans]|uniref:TetR/AcrR family transcriptional regulator n=1 Tax=Ruania halotolerans TaxID=2897773 RepID=UPI001E4B6CDC|nr:TetR/AcrR family transcriptional regulator [Ruania halotolerans]UFU06454.1 TetR/AcrR family transcriptional regulator [Ruania halotolerans]